MANTSWGLLGPDLAGSERRTRTLGLGAAVRAFNDLAVPGLGNVYFGKQLVLATLGVAVAEKLRAAGRSVQNIETANAVEALACWLALDHNGWQSDPRLRGATKMRSRYRRDLTFAVMRKRGFYVTQPMRMATAQPLLALGLVEAKSERFNAFACTAEAHDLLKTLCDSYPGSYRSRTVLDHLAGWAGGEVDGISTSREASDTLRRAISPLEPLPDDTRGLLREALTRVGREGADRRSAMLAWVGQLAASNGPQVTWETKPSVIKEDHWQDMHSGALFFTVRDHAMTLLDQIEAHLAQQQQQRLLLQQTIPAELQPQTEMLRKSAETFLSQDHDPSPDALASGFCREICESDQPLEQLVKRDDRVLRLSSGAIVPGPAYRGKMAATADGEEASNEEEDPEEPVSVTGLPERISLRASNLLLFNLDLQGQLGAWWEETP